MAKHPGLFLILLLVVFFILHISLFPWQFQPLTPEMTPLVILLHSWPRLSRRIFFDITANLALYVPFGVCLYLVIRPHLSKWAAIFTAAFFGGMLSASLEIAQIFVPPRICSMADLLSNTCGTAAGAAAACLLEQRLKSRLTDKPWRLSGALLLLACWIGYQVYPLMPDTSFGALLRRLWVLPPGPLFLAPVSIVDWLVVDALLRSAIGARHARTAFPLFLMLVPARLIIRWRTVTWSELAALPCALAFRALPPGKNARVLPALLTAAILVTGLWPFRTAAEPAPFQWAPFHFLVAANWSHAPVVLLLKTFRYGSLLWLLRAAGVPFLRAGIIVGVFLSGMEYAQVYLAGHSPEITDPLLAVALSIVLFTFERFNWSQRATNLD